VLLNSNNQSNHYAESISIDDIKNNIETVQMRIINACRRSNRDPNSVRLLLVSKTKPQSILRLAHQAGCTMLGENKVQEAYNKWEQMQDLADLNWSIIGHLQTNKAKFVAKFATEFQALDSLRVAEALDRRLQIEGRMLDVFIQVNTSNEASKYGLMPDEVSSFLQKMPVFSALKVRGLMTLAVFSNDMTKVRNCFILLREMRDKLRQSTPSGISLNELSMGMSGDFEIAIEEGATVVRVGQAIFGKRPTPDNHYWPGN